MKTESGNVVKNYDFHQVNRYFIVSLEILRKENFNDEIIYALFELKQRGTHQFEHLDGDG